MRRPLAILALASISWSNLAAVPCATGEGTHDVWAEGMATRQAADPGEHRHFRHAGHEADEERTPSGTDGAGRHRDGGCRTVMTCGTPMIRPVVAPATLGIATPSVQVGAPVVAAYSAAPPTAEPPPPKRFA